MATDAEDRELLAIVYKRGSLRLLNQKKLPHVLDYEEVTNSDEVWHQIRDMKVRGAPAIAIAAALGLSVEVQRCATEAAQRAAQGSAEDAIAFVKERLAYLRTSRPTAVNLMAMCDRMADAVSGAQTAADVFRTVEEVAEAILHEDAATNKAMGEYGAKEISNGQKVTILTHCNTGSLATGRYGTALGVIRQLHSLGCIEHVYCTETRPYNQGARLTAFELVHEGIPATLITDSMVAWLMKNKKIDAVVVGADRVTANGDTANKIGTFAIAMIAKQFGVRVYIASPISTLDTSIASGEEIEIEERPAEELTHINGERIAASGIGVWNPAFDVTPYALIDGIITEKGVIRRKGAEAFDVVGFLS